MTKLETSMHQEIGRALVAFADVYRRQQTLHSCVAKATEASQRILRGSGLPSDQDVIDRLPLATRDIKKVAEEMESAKQDIHRLLAPVMDESFHSVFFALATYVPNKDDGEAEAA